MSRAFRRLPGATRSSDGLQAVADGVAHEMQERVHHPLDEELVDLRLLPAKSSSISLPLSRARSRTTNRMRSKISPTCTSRTRITPSRRSRSWRDIARLVSCNARHSAGRDRALQMLQALVQPRAAHDQLADQPHQLVEPREVDAHDVGGREHRRGGVAGWPVVGRGTSSPGVGRAGAASSTGV